MSNSLTTVLPKILARGLLALREQAVMPRLVNADYSAEAARKGDTIDVPLPSAIAASDVTPSNTPPTASDSTISQVQIALSNWKKVGFHLSDKEVMEIDRYEKKRPVRNHSGMRRQIPILVRFIIDPRTKYCGNGIPI